jgi:hypothetical protein
MTLTHTRTRSTKLCGMGRVEFLLAAGRAGVPVAALDDDELSAEVDAHA